MLPAKLIGIRHLRRGERRIPVLLTLNERGGVAGQCILEDSERPIIDGASVEEVLQAIEDVLDGLLLARRRVAARP
jgi:hypothetical protein